MLCTKCKENIKLSEAAYRVQNALGLWFFHAQCVPPRTTAQRLPEVLMDTRPIYKALDIKNKMLIEKTCPKVCLDDVYWYDTTQYGFHDEKRYLQSRGILIIHPVAFALVRFKE